MTALERGRFIAQMIHDEQQQDGPLNEIALQSHLILGLQAMVSECSQLAVDFEARVSAEHDALDPFLCPEERIYLSGQCAAAKQIGRMIQNLKDLK